MTRNEIAERVDDLRMLLYNLEKDAPETVREAQDKLDNLETYLLKEGD